MSGTYLPGDIRQRIQDLIKSRKITQAKLAERVGLSSSTLSRYLQGRTANLGDGFIIRGFPDLIDVGCVQDECFIHF